jgi:hypothetical protein
MVQPSSLGALVEWRVDGRAVLLGASGSYTCDNTPGEHAIEAGPVGRSRTVYLDTYAVTIESNAGLSQVQDGTFVTFRAITEPPGYESQVTWLASTLYGLVSQVTGTGEMFTARFDGSITNGDPPRWIGVRADNALLFTDCCVPPGNCVCNSIAWSLPLNVMPSCPPFGFGNNQYAVVQVTNTGPPETLTYKVFDYDLETPNDLLYEATKLCPTGTSTLNLEAFLFSDANCNVTGYGGSSGGFPEAEGRTAEVFYVLYAPGGGALCITSIQDVTCPP